MDSFCVWTVFLLGQFSTLDSFGRVGIAFDNFTAQHSWYQIRWLLAIVNHISQRSLQTSRLSKLVGSGLPTVSGSYQYIHLQLGASVLQNFVVRRIQPLPVLIFRGARPRQLLIFDDSKIIVGKLKLLASSNQLVWFCCISQWHPRILVSRFLLVLITSRS